MSDGSFSCSKWLHFTVNITNNWRWQVILAFIISRAFMCLSGNDLSAENWNIRLLMRLKTWSISIFFFFYLPSDVICPLTNRTEQKTLWSVNPSTKLVLLGFPVVTVHHKTLLISFFCFLHYHLFLINILFLSSLYCKLYHSNNHNTLNTVIT